MTTSEWKNEVGCPSVTGTVLRRALGHKLLQELLPNSCYHPKSYTDEELVSYIHLLAKANNSSCVK